MTHMWFSRRIINWRCDIKSFIHLINLYLNFFLFIFYLLVYSNKGLPSLTALGLSLANFNNNFNNLIRQAQLGCPCRPWPPACLYGNWWERLCRLRLLRPALCLARRSCGLIGPVNSRKTGLGSRDFERNAQISCSKFQGKLRVFV